MKYKRTSSSVDGFIPRRNGSQLGERHQLGSPSAPARKELKSEDDLASEYVLGQPRENKELGRADRAASPRPFSGADTSELDDSLRSLDDIDENNGGKSGRRRKLSRKERRRIKNESRTRAQRIRRRVILSVVWVLVAALVAAGGYLAFKAFQATGNVLNGNIFDIITQNEPLKQDANGRSNFLIVGTSEDDKGHDAGWLTDSIMILSIDQKNKNAYTFSIPRDLYVDFGRACFSGYKNKINGYFQCVNSGTDDAAEQDRLQGTQKFIGDIVGMDLHYGVHVNYTVMRDVIKAIGGSIDVTIKSRHPLGILDSNFDWKCGGTYYEKIKNCPPDGHFIQFPNGPVTLDAERALYLAQARGHTAPTYGLEQSNFDRERNQQMILVAIRDKALSAGTLTNIGAVTGLIDALGNNLRTNVQAKEVRTLMALAKDIPSSAIKSIDLYDKDEPMFTTGNIPGAGSSVYPSAGVFNYTQLQAYLKKQLTSDPVAREGAAITVLNGSETSGAAQTLAMSLEAKGFMIDEVNNAPNGTYERIEIYQLNEDAPATAAKLAELYGVTLKKSTPPVSVTGDTDFLIIIGDGSVVQ